MLAKGCKAVTEYAKTKGIKTSVENHGFYCQQSDRVEALINAVNDDNFGWLVDIGNFLCADEMPLDAVKVGVKHIVYAHVKDFYFADKSVPTPRDILTRETATIFAVRFSATELFPLRNALSL